MRSCVPAPRPELMVASKSVNLRRAFACTSATSTGSACQISSSQVIECSKAATSLSGEVSARPIWAGASCCCIDVLILDPHEVPDRVLRENGRVLELLDVALVLEVGAGQHELTRPMGAGQHVLELDLGETPLRVRRANRFPDLRDKRLATAWPALGMGACRGEHTGRKSRQTRALGALCRHGCSTFQRRDFA